MNKTGDIVIKSLINSRNCYNCFKCLYAELHEIHQSNNEENKQNQKQENIKKIFNCLKIVYELTYKQIKTF